MAEMTSEAKTVATAVEEALKKLGLRRDQVEVQILQESSSGFMGIGARPARVRIREKRWEPESPETPVPNKSAQAAKSDTQQHPPINPQSACAEALALLKEVLRLMSISDAALQCAWDSVQERVKITVDSPQAQSLVNKDGKPLESLQFLLTLMLSRRLKSPVAAQVDALGFWENKEREILSQAQQGIDEVKRTGKPLRLAPMDAATRRLVHRSFADHPDIVTASEGEGLWRKIVLRPRKG